MSPARKNIRFCSSTILYFKHTFPTKTRCRCCRCCFPYVWKHFQTFRLRWSPQWQCFPELKPNINRYRCCCFEIAWLPLWFFAVFGIYLFLSFGIWCCFFSVQCIFFLHWIFLFLSLLYDTSGAFEHHLVVSSAELVCPPFVVPFLLLTILTID